MKYLSVHSIQLYIMCLIILETTAEFFLCYFLIEKFDFCCLKHVLLLMMQQI
jgi:hypothetical protein